MIWQFVGSLAAIDRFRQTIVLVRNVFVSEDPAAQYDEAVERLNSDAARLARPLEYEARGVHPDPTTPAVASTFDKPEFTEAVKAAKAYIEQGDAFQIVVSQRLETDFDGDPFAVYRALRLVNPSPFLFFVRDDEVTVVGSSPELMTRVRDGIAYSRPIAGTKPRGATPDEDRLLEEELLSDPKERAEHVMLIDLARNDLGRVCEFGSVNIKIGRASCRERVLDHV